MYSIERMMAFDEYCRRTPLRRVAAVCLLSPVPAVAIVILLEIMPLRSPNDGCLTNYVFWLRHWFSIIIILEGLIRQAKAWIPELPLSAMRMTVLSVSTSGIYVAINILVAYYWVFPIPFLAVCGGIVMFPIWVAGVVIAVGKASFADISNIKYRLKSFLDLQSAHSSLMILYPANNAVFLALPAAWRTPYMFILPLLNLVMKNAVAAKGRHLEDRLPETVVFAVNAFSAIYSIFCMRSSNSISSVAIIFAFNVVTASFALYGMHIRTPFARELIEESVPSSSPERDSIGETIYRVSRLAPKALSMLGQPGQLDPTQLRDIRLLSGLKHNLDGFNTALLSALEKRAVYDNVRRPSIRPSFADVKAMYASGSLLIPTQTICDEGLAQLNLSLSKHTIGSAAGQRIITAITNAPAITNRVTPAESQPVDSLQSLVLRQTPITDVLVLTRKKNTVAVKEALQLLFTSEYLCLTVYVHCIIPPIFILYMSVLHNLPNAQYYPRAVEIADTEQMIERMNTITFYWGLELAVLFVVHLVLARKFALPALYQIAFVLETHAVLVQCKLVFTVIYSVQSAMTHYGADYSFQFAWMRRHPPALQAGSAP